MHALIFMLALTEAIDDHFKVGYIKTKSFTTLESEKLCKKRKEISDVGIHP